MRIVAGLAKGRRLAAPPPGTRPSSDRLREAMFSSLEASGDLHGARLLDLYAGTGAVGLEALSRGANAAVFVESNRRAVAVLRRNIATVALPGAHLVASAVETALAHPPERGFDLVFADPPYEQDNDAVLQLLTTLCAPGWLNPSATVIVERSVREPLSGWNSELLTFVARRRYGDSALWYGRRR